MDTLLWPSSSMSPLNGLSLDSFDSTYSGSWLNPYVPSSCSDQLLHTLPVYHQSSLRQYQSASSSWWRQPEPWSSWNTQMPALPSAKKPSEPQITDADAFLALYHDFQFSFSSPSTPTTPVTPVASGPVHVICDVPLVAPRPLPYTSPTFLQFDLPDDDEDLSHPPYTQRPAKRKRDADDEVDHDQAASPSAKRRTLAVASSSSSTTTSSAALLYPSNPGHLHHSRHRR